MNSVNNIYRVIDTPPYKRYVKTLPSKVAGVRFDAEGKQQTGFLLQSSETGFNYDDEVLEVYTEREDRAIRQLNRALFSQGFLKEYRLDAPEVDTRNMLSDEDVVTVASIRNIKQLQARLLEFDSPLTLQRILTAANDVGRPAKTVEVIKARLDEVSA